MTQDELKRRFEYDPGSGVFYSRRSGRCVGYVERGYVRITIGNKRYRAHRLAFLYMTGSMPNEVDHINNMKSDNRWCNLRASCRQGNNANKRVRRDCKSRRKGVYLTKNGKYVANITVNGRSLYLGTFECPDKAHGAYSAAAVMAFGSNARVGQGAEALVSADSAGVNNGSH